ncbi:LysM peptidoglycan-binding domain-containing protein [Arthrobacter russicus]|uniref:LysM peptidoglycan-binding domain-containing protein n=2 Tax=Arthrobacter russicus TaxID=172040 RepID=UPI00286C1F8A|nr:LysM peptidoglycan-binding domain-containing protein [Arthrobacter russicus]
MTSPRQPKPGASRQAKQLAAVSTAALPVIMLSSLALAQPANAVAGNQPQNPRTGSNPANSAPASLSAAVKNAVAKAIANRGQASVVPAGQVAGLVPTFTGSVKPAAPAASSYTVRAGDTVSAIAARNGLNVNDVLKLNGLSANSLIFPGQQIKLSGTAAAPAPAAPSTGGASYTVRAGDTVSAIAARNGLNVNDVLKLNGLGVMSIIRPGQVLSLSAGAPAAPAPAAPAPATTAPAPAPAPAGGSYTIKPGDTLTSIAARNSVSLGELLRANNLGMNSVIYAGKKLTIPGAAVAASNITPVAPATGPSTFGNYTYPEAVVSQANLNRAALAAAPLPSIAEVKQLVASTAAQMGVDPSLALAFALQESSFQAHVVSPANAIGTMQVIPQSGQWASELVGRHLNLLNPQDNIVAGIAIIRALVRTSPSLETAIAGYYQGQTAVKLYGMYPDTKVYVAEVLAKQKMFS